MEWQPQIGEQVFVNIDCDEPWAVDWVDAAGRPLPMFVAGVRAIAGGGVDVTVSEEWPIKAPGIFSSSPLTDGFVVGRDGQRDHLLPEPPRNENHGD